ncbi:MAG TPA: transcriptional regulator [Bacteroidales bacterium]|nr:MAG: hypothetical protein A2X11_08160 [Bacteroidetes bacterium GWE2_42_24]OFY32404.1 MAG: hypothetical protein A2X09_15445 [Bacteroidetes bacterium GWF2_43_11]HAQ64584.1 transcriptional regulator [Bacteroidales bacterium]HBZ68210.1 transcriptional regulator [Bacteroidales bacterium]
MLDTLITSKTRLKLLLRFFLNSNSEAHLRLLAGELGESSNAIRVELNRFEHAGLLTSRNESNRRVFRANTSHPLFPDINSIIRKYIGIDQILDKVIAEIGAIERVYLSGSLAQGINNPIIDLIIVGCSINMEFLSKLVSKASGLINRHISYVVMTAAEYQSSFPGNAMHLLIFGVEPVSDAANGESG